MHWRFFFFFRINFYFYLDLCVGIYARFYNAATNAFLLSLIDCDYHTFNAAAAAAFCV